MTHFYKQDPVRREIFNPENQIHIDSFKTFLRTGNWGDVQFYCEVPYEDVPATVMMKFAEFELNVVRETAKETQDRLSAKTDLIRAVPLTAAQEADEKRARLAETNRKMLEVA